MTSADLLYLPAGTLVSELEYDGLDMVANWVEFGGLRRTVHVAELVQDDDTGFVVKDLAGKPWILRPYDADDYQIRTGVRLGDLEDARAAYDRSLDASESAEGVAADRMDKFAWSGEDLSHLTIVKR